MREERIVLEDEADAALAHGDIGGVLLAEIDRAAVGIFEAGDHAQDRRLAGTGRAEQRDELAAFDIERDAVHGTEGLELLDHVFEADLHGLTSGVMLSAPASADGRWTRPAPRRSSATLATSVTMARQARMDAAAKAPAAL